MNNRIKVIDSPMGTGKTSWAINHINDLPDDTKVIYITPFLNEVDRIIKSCSGKHFIQPSDERTSKSKDILKLVEKSENIVSTHSLFMSISQELINALKANNYILFLDEVFQTVEKFDIDERRKVSQEVKDAETKNDVEELLEKNYIRINDDYSLEWIDNSELSKYRPLKNLIDRKLIYYVHGSLLLWTFPIEVFKETVFEEIYILTHRFSSQVQAAYYNYFNLQYSLYHIENSNGYIIVETANNDYEKEWIEKIKPLIRINENYKLNKIGNVYKDSQGRYHKTALSMSWYRNNPDLFNILKNNITNFYINYCKNSQSNQRLWTCFKDYVIHLKSRHISPKHWLALNAKATNDYGKRNALAYLINRYLDPFYDDFFDKKGIKINQDEYALSEMLQWIWRGAVRNNEVVDIYIPSERMRTLLKKYLNQEKIEF